MYERNLEYNNKVDVCYYYYYYLLRIKCSTKTYIIQIQHTSKTNKRRNAINYTLTINAFDRVDLTKLMTILQNNRSRLERERGN